MSLFISDNDSINQHQSFRQALIFPFSPCPTIINYYLGEKFFSNHKNALFSLKLEYETSVRVRFSFQLSVFINLHLLNRNRRSNAIKICSVSHLHEKVIRGKLFLTFERTRIHPERVYVYLPIQQMYCNVEAFLALCFFKVHHVEGNPLSYNISHVLAF